MPPFDPLTVPTDLDKVGSFLSSPTPTANWLASFQGLTLQTALQPIFSISHKRIVGYEALVRALDNDQSPVLPMHLFDLPHDQTENLLLDRLCRYLHIRNFSDLPDNINWLFLNVSPKTVANGTHHDAFFGQLLELTGFPPHRVVVEIVEQPTDDAEQLRRTVEYYRSLGCLTAIDDFGAGHSNFERIWNLRPDIVKLDRQMLVRATEDKRTRQILKGIATLLHQSGCLVLLEGVETHEQAMIAVDAGVDFVQGFYFCRPTTELDSLARGEIDFDNLLNDYKHLQQDVTDPAQGIANFFSVLFDDVVAKLQRGEPFIDPCRCVVEHHTVSRCYLIDENGVQLHDSLSADSRHDNQDLRFRPLEDTYQADWYRQHYLRRALHNPAKIQVTRPYLSVTGAHMCITLSLSFNHLGKTRVLCCDILAD
ncbi:MAG: EAL domain-containing protein [Halomonadaceae bacterium]|nr:MAG: EAL domain-containing protein [Halomonadaceae bacterium]